MHSIARQEARRVEVNKELDLDLSLENLLSSRSLVLCLCVVVIGAVCEKCVASCGKLEVSMYCSIDVLQKAV